MEAASGGLRGFFWGFHKGPRFMSCPELGFFPNPRWVSSQTLSPHCQSLPYQYPILAKKKRNLTKRKTMEAASGGLHGFFFGPTKVQGLWAVQNWGFFPNPRWVSSQTLSPNCQSPDSGEKVEKFDQKKNHGGCLWRPPWFFFGPTKVQGLWGVQNWGFFS